MNCGLGLVLMMTFFAPAVLARTSQSPVPSSPEQSVIPTYDRSQDGQLAPRLPLTLALARKLQVDTIDAVRLIPYGEGDVMAAEIELELTLSTLDGRAFHADQVVLVGDNFSRFRPDYDRPLRLVPMLDLASSGRGAEDARATQKVITRFWLMNGGGAKFLQAENITIALEFPRNAFAVYPSKPSQSLTIELNRKTGDFKVVPDLCRKFLVPPAGHPVLPFEGRKTSQVQGDRRP